MHLHRLTLAGVGPFRDEHTVDLDALAASGLFLLEGPTGAGKSTVIDAIVFALYGAVADDAADDARMVSDLLRGSDVEPFVELEFTTGHGRFRVRRTPRFTRPKRRGHGETTVNPTMVLARLSGPGATPETVATSLQEAAVELGRILGLSRAQFVQTVVLPQGRFASFLHADAVGRRALLQTVFGTERYRRLQDELATRRAGARRRRDDADGEVLKAASRLAGAAGPDDESRCAVEEVAGDDDALHDVVTALLTRLGDDEKLAAEADRAAAERRAGAEAELRSVRERAARRNRRAELERRQEAWARRRPEAEQAQVRLLLADRAARVADALSARADAAAGLDTAVASLATAAAAAGPLVDAGAGSDPAAWAQAERRRRAGITALAPAAEDERQLPQGRADVEAAAQREQQAQARVAVVATDVEAMPAVLAEARAAVEAAAATAAGVEAAAREHASATRRHGAAERLPRLAGAWGAAEEEVARGHAAATAAQHEHDRLLRARLDAMAGVLAADLRDGEACPVCGSPEHPAPAPAPDTAVDESALEAAAATAAAAGDALRDAAARREAARAAAAGGCVEAGIAVPDDPGDLVALAEAVLTAAAAALDEAAAVHQAATAAEERLPSLREAAAEADERAARLQQDLVAAQQQAAAATTLHRERADRLAACEAAVRDAATPYPTVAARIAAMEAEAVVLGAAVVAAGRHDAAAARLAAADTALAAALAREGFPDAGAAASAALPDAERHRCETLVAEVDAEGAAVAGGLADPDLAGVDPDEVIDLQGVEAAAEAAAQGADDALAEHRAATGRLADTQARAEELREAVDHRRVVHEGTAAVIRAADLVAGGNERRLELSAFVLQQRFAEVVAAANQRLADMSGGRYELVDDDSRQGAGRAGLGIAVLDARTGRRRLPTTLSGGETFYCSLALALGLADVVRAEAGGVDLGTLFVDEGFGSLDPDTLTAVLDVLAGLRSGGRVVGVVSHVTELHECIPDRLEVRPLPDGASTWTLRAGTG